MTKPRMLALGIGTAGAACALAGWHAAGWGRWLWAWTALACFLVTGAYLLNRPGIFGKRDGRLVWWRALPVLPYLLAFWLSLWLVRAVRRLPPYDEVAPGLYVGGRVRASDLPRGVELIVDLTSEYSAPLEIRSRPGYRCLPVLDGSTPPDEAPFLELLDELLTTSGAIYIHCESGVGRAPTAAASVLIARGVADGPRAAIELIRKSRPSASPTSSDVRFIERVLERPRP